MKKYGRKVKRARKTKVLTKEQLVEIHAEAYYRALKRIETEQRDERERRNSDEKKNYQMSDVLFYINAILWPWKINKRFNVNKHIYDNILSGIISLILKVFGFCLWIPSVAMIAYTIYDMIFLKSFDNGVLLLGIGSVSLLWGSIFVIAGNEFEKEKDSNTIYAYSASILALISCILSLAALLKR